MRCRGVSRVARQGGLAFPHAVTTRVTEPNQRPEQKGVQEVSEATQTTGVCAPRGSHTGPVWQTGCKRAASEEHMSGMWVTG